MAHEGELRICYPERDPVAPYECPFCSAWHVGRKPLDANLAERNAHLLLMVRKTLLRQLSCLIASRRWGKPMHSVSGERVAAPLRNIGRREAVGAVEWHVHPPGDSLSLQRYAEIEGVTCWIDLPYDDTVDYRVHVYLNHPKYRNGGIVAESSLNARTWDAAVWAAERRARLIARWCSGPTDEPEPTS